MVYEMNHYELRIEIEDDLRSYERNFYNCVEKPEKSGRGLNPCPHSGATL